MSGLFVTFEGCEGSGKTTQVRMLCEWLRLRGIETVETREPGGTLIGASIRALLLNKTDYVIDPTTELLLMAADRTQHVAEVILPTLQQGKIVVCDRYADSTIAYQGYGRGMDSANVMSAIAIATNGLTPDLTFLLDIDPEVGLARRMKQGGANRFESETLAFHKRVRDGYRAMCKQAQSEQPLRWRFVDARIEPEFIHEYIREQVWERIEAMRERGL